MSRVYKPNIIMSVHAFESAGSWNDDISEAIGALNCTAVPFKYDSSAPFDKSSADLLLLQFKDWYIGIVGDPAYQIDINDPFIRPSIVADGFGTWIVGEAIINFREIKFDKLFLYNSIIPTSFDWYLHIMRDQVQLIVTELTKTDQAIPLPSFLSGKQPTSYSIGFEQPSRSLKYEDKERLIDGGLEFINRFKTHYKKYLSFTPSQLCVVYGRDLGLPEFKKYFDSTARLDAEIYGEDYNENPIAIETALTWAKKEPDIWSFLVDSYSKEVIGYLNVLPVNNITFERFINGTLIEKEIKPENLLAYKEATDFNIIIMSIAIKKSLLEPGAGLPPSKHGELLQMAMMQKLVDLTITGKKRLDRAASLVWTNSGLKFSERFGLLPTATAYMDYPVYAAGIDEIIKENSNKLSPIAKWFFKRINGRII